ncbi:MAG: M24 family metallopeptidase C-terminal domain-containing protein, partial [Bacteroidales bacterium]|nr:M24 family metallopeptidase C-terminal domain-containing protein [Candidatus Cacconaster equifaecalis]
TGHGIGYYLGVHEGPQSIRQNFNRQPLLPGMVTSNEPGLYREGKYGIRHENVVLCVEDGENEFASWLRFETLTLCHIDTAPVKTKLLDDEELAWLNNYNARVYKALSPFLDPATGAWLKKKCRKLRRGWFE